MVYCRSGGLTCITLAHIHNIIVGCCDNYIHFVVTDRNVCKHFSGGCLCFNNNCIISVL